MWSSLEDETAICNLSRFWNLPKKTGFLSRVRLFVGYWSSPNMGHVQPRVDQELTLGAAK
jgi:hypothetical protein